MFKEPGRNAVLPKPGEYLLGMVIALIVVAVALFLAALVGGEAPDMAAPIVAVVLFYGGLSMIVFGLPLVLVTHLLVRRVRSQTVQVAAFTVTGLMAALLPGLMIGADAAGLPVYLAAAGAGGLSRALLILVMRARAARVEALADRAAPTLPI